MKMSFREFCLYVQRKSVQRIWHLPRKSVQRALTVYSTNSISDFFAFGSYSNEIQPTDSCPLQFYGSNQYVLPYNRPSFRNQANPIKRSFDKYSNGIANRYQLKKESLNLISKNLVRDMFIRPLNGFIKYYIVTKSVIYG